MQRVRDLTEVINDRVSPSYMSTALMLSWQWHGHERDEAAAGTAWQRRLGREANAQHHGVRLRHLGD